MDDYTQKTKVWLDTGFKGDEVGIYFAHQPIYGFEVGHSEPGLIGKYIRTYQIMKALSHLEFSSLLDVGGAEGYKASLAARLFRIAAHNCDLSQEACKRARDIFNVESDVIDAHNLPYKDNAFDVVLCSEVLEHVTDHHTVIYELLRVASKAVVITVPHESHEVVKKNIEEALPHSHIHSFELESFDFLKNCGYRVKAKRIISPLLRFPSKLLPIKWQEHNEKYPKMVFSIYNLCVPILKRVMDKKTAAFLIYLDDIICRFTSRYDAIACIILKNNDVYTEAARLSISPLQIIDYKVPYHYAI